METAFILDKIKEMADTLAEDGSTFTRSDLAWDLKDDLAKVGITGDSPEISRLVWECYQKTKDEAVAKSFVTNSRSFTLVEEYTIPALVEAGDTDSVFGTVNKKLAKSEGILGQLKTLMTEGVNLSLVDAASNLINTVSGVEAIKRVQDEAQHIFAKYSEMTGTYSDARNTIRELVSDFSEIRQSTCETYKKYALALVDIFGDSIKATMPELFNFDAVEFLDVDAMHQNVKLEYDSIYGKCGALVGDVSEGFSNALSRSASQFSIQKDRSVGLVLAGINMSSHYIKTGLKTTALHRDFAELRGSISNDVAAIRTDEVRLVEIYKVLNDVMIPEAEVFARNSDKVFDKEFESLVDTIYATPEARDLKQQRDEILKEMHAIERRINDANISINYYKDHIQSSQETLGSLKENYIEAQVSKPEPPNMVGNILMFGGPKRRYERDLYDWDKNCSPVIDNYEGLAVDISVDTDEIERRTKAIADDTLKYNELKLKEVSITKRLASIVTSSPETKRKAAEHLDDIIKLLHLAKKITEGKLDDHLLKAAKVTKLDDIQLPEKLTTAVKDFRDSITKDMKFTEGTARTLAGKKASQEAITNIAVEGNAVLQEGIDLCNNLAQLKVMKLKQGLAQEIYDREFAKIKEAFAERMKAIDDRAAFIQEAARKINTADDHDSLKKALIELAGDYTTGMTPQDWDDFLEGKKTIQI
ncbi:MAG: hypothetical protein J5595_08685 [Bacteroidales bacterium]|nr:hypothetical protein [Bacteroidales bacterium]